MGISQKDIKLLWGRAANKCSFPDCKIRLSVDGCNGSYPVGEQAHIVAEEPTGPRGNSPLSSTERNTYHNLILLCPTHHTIIDRDPIGYPVEKLHIIKSEHELWVEETFSSPSAVIKPEDVTNLIYTDLIDSAVELCSLEEWDKWTFSALSPTPKWQTKFSQQLKDFRYKVFRTIWPRVMPELENSIITLAVSVNEAYEIFSCNCEPWYDDWLKPRRIDDEWNFELVEEHEKWLDRCQYMVIEATKAANWFAEVVRRDINPLFFSTKGKFIAHHGPYEDFSYRTSLPEYSTEEKSKLPMQLENDIKTYNENNKGKYI